MAEAGLRTDNAISRLKTREAELSQHPERAATMEGLMFAPLARAQGEVSSKRLCSVCNRSSTCTYYNSEHASSCPEIHFPSFVVVHWNSWPCCLAKASPCHSAEREQVQETAHKQSTLTPCSMLLCGVRYSVDSVGFRGFASMLSSEIGTRACPMKWYLLADHLN